MRGSSALKRLEEERLGQLAKQAKQYITLMKEYRYNTFIEKNRYKTLMEKNRNISLMEEYLHKLISLSFNSMRLGFLCICFGL